jgi:DNA uptake protein ComE-like DNA-binding protein
MSVKNSQVRLAFAIVSLAALSACTQRRPENPDDLKEKTAQTTAAAKRDAKAIAEGIREGWSRDKPLDLNSATKEQLENLPGINAAQADKVIATRPYDEPRDLVTRHVLSNDQYTRIADRVTVKK